MIVLFGQAISTDLPDLSGPALVHLLQMSLVYADELRQLVGGYELPGSEYLLFFFHLRRSMCARWSLCFGIGKEAISKRLISE